MAQCSTPRTAGLHATVFLDVPGGWSLKGLTRLRDERHQDREGTDGETDEQGTDQEPPPSASVGVPLSGKPVAEGSIVRILHHAPDSLSRGDYALVPMSSKRYLATELDRGVAVPIKASAGDGLTDQSIRGALVDR